MAEQDHVERIRTASFLSLSGRINRRTFLVRLGALLVISLPLYGLLRFTLYGLLGFASPDYEWGGLVFVVLTFPTLAQRQHDYGWQGWIGIIAWTPAIFLVLPFLLLWPGNREENGYGGVPTGWWKAVK